MLHIDAINALYDAAHLALTLEWGTNEQVDAENLFGDILERELEPEAYDRFCSYALKATTEEMVDFGLQLADEARG